MHGRFMVLAASLLIGFLPATPSFGTTAADTNIVIVGGESAIGAQIATSLESCTTGTVTRIAGANRYETAAEMAKASFTSAARVYIATGSSFPDALAVGPVASAITAPILLVTNGSLPDVTRAEITRLDPSEIVIVGGPAAIGTRVENLLVDGYPGAVVTRIGGANRYATAADISASHFPTGVSTVYIATGSNFPDALAGGIRAATAGGPILLTGVDALPPETATELTRLEPDAIVVLGGVGAVSDAVVSELGSYTTGSVTRIAGSDRYATASGIAADGFPGRSETVYIVTGLNFPDALALTPAATGGPLLLASERGLPAPTAASIASLSGVPCDAFQVAAGPIFAIGDSVMRGVACNPAIPPCYSKSINLESEIENLTSNAAVSRQFSEARSIIRAEIQAGRTPAVLVIHLGTNGPPTDSQFAALMDVAKDIPRVLFLTVKVDRWHEAQTNAVIRTNVDKYTKAELVDWKQLADKNPSWLAADSNYGAHLWTSGARAGYVGLINAAIGN